MPMAQVYQDGLTLGVQPSHASNVTCQMTFGDEVCQDRLLDAWRMAAVQRMAAGK